MTDRKDDQGTKTGEQAPSDLDYLDMPRIYRRPQEARDDGDDYLPLPRIVCRGIGAWREEKPSLWFRLRRWISGS